MMISRRRLLAGGLLVPVLGIIRPARAQLDVNQLYGFGSGGGIATVTFTDSSVDTSNTQTYSFASQALGTAQGDRKIVVIPSMNGTNATVSSLTVGGIAGSFLVRSTDAEFTIEIWQANVPTETTGTIAVNWSAATPARCGIGVFAVYGAEATVHDTGSGTGNPASDTINCPAGGVVVAGSYGVGGASPFTNSWTGLTKRYDEIVEGDVLHSGASDAFAAAQTGLAVSTTYNDTPSRHGFVAASWGPS